MRKLWKSWCIYRLVLVGALLLLGSSCESGRLAELRSPGKVLASASSGDMATNPRDGASLCLGGQQKSTMELVYLRSRVTSGDPQAARCLVMNLRFLDGGELEDSLIALGEFSKHQMAYFLSLRKDNMISHASFENALTMLPLVMTESPQSCLIELAIRKAAVLDVDDQSLSVQRQAALEALDRFSDEIKSK